MTGCHGVNKKNYFRVKKIKICCKLKGHKECGTLEKSVEFPYCPIKIKYFLGFKKLAELKTFD